MSKKTKQIIAIILCITMVIGFDNVYGYRTIFKYINSVIVTKAGEVKDNADSKNGETSEKTESESETDSPAQETVQEETIAPDAIIDDIEESTDEAENVTDSSDETEKETTTSISQYNSNKKNNSKNNTNSNVNSYTNNNTSSNANSSVNSNNSSNNNSVSKNTDDSTDNEPIPNTDTTIAGQGEVIEGDAELIDGKNTRVQVTKAENFVKNGVYYIQSQTDWTKFAQISQTSTLEDMTFVIYRRESKYDDWNLTNIKIGNKDYPFSGSIYQLYTSSVINTNVVLFEYLSSKAKIGRKEGNKNYSITINYTQNVNAGLATNLLLDKGSTVYMGDAKESNYYVKIKGPVKSSSMAAGGLFSYIKINENSTVEEGQDETATIYLDGISNIDLSTLYNSLYGKTAGGLIGDITGKINLIVKSIPKTTTTVSAYATNEKEAAGGLIGRVGDGVKVTFENTDPITLNSSTSYFNGSYGYTAGGLIGCVDNAEVYADSDGGIIQKSNVSALRYAGGLIGYAINSKIVVKNYTQNSGTYIYQYSKGTLANNLAAGGVIGKFYCDTDNSDGKLELSYIKSSNKTAATASNIRITTTSTNYNKRGGLVGIIDSGASNVYIHDINTDAKETGAGGDNCYYVNLIYIDNNVNNYQSQAESGGLAGVIAGTDIKIENVVFNYVYISGSNGKDSNSISGNIVGDIVARAGFVNNTHKNTKITIKDINVMSNYIEYVNSYHGGLFGVLSNTAVAMQGTINLSKVPYKTYSNSQRFANAIVLLGTEGNRGFLAGYINRSFVYEDTDCVYTRPITYNDDGTIKEFDADNIKYSNWWNADTNSTPKYCIDDIGNYGSVLKNVEDVLQIDNDYDNIVTGKIDKDSDGNYVIDSLGDALRLAIAGNTADNDTGYPKFGGNCFVADGEDIPKVADILSYNYKVTTDLDMQQAGIHGFVRNDSVRYAFTGSFVGVQTDGKNPVITLDFISNQKYGGLFTNATNAVFKNLDITGNLHYIQGYGVSTLDANYNIRAGAGSLAAYASGNISIDNVNISTSIKVGAKNYTTWDNGYMYCYGGIFGLYYPGTANATYECINSKIAPHFSAVRSNSFVGGMIGWMRVNSSSVVKKMNIDNCTIGTEIIANKLFSYNATGNYIHGRLSGFIGLISNDYYDVGSTGGANIKPSNIDNFTFANINMNDITVDGVNIDMTEAGGNYTRTIGGILGYSWAYADVSITGLTVRNSKIASRGVTGGLVSFMNGRINLKDITLESFDMSNVKQAYGSGYCSFLIGNGQNAFTTIENYNIATDGKVTETGYASFDEIVGLTVKLRDKSNGTENFYASGQNIDETYSVGGIVNIIDSDFNSFTDNTASYHSYVNRVADTKNNYTRYYYNLFTGDSTEWTITNGNIENAKQLMTFTVSRYARDTFNRFIKEYFTGGSYFKTYNINNDLDLNGYSYYPAPMSDTMIMNFNNHTVTLYGEEVDSLEKALNTSGANMVFRSNADVNSQHYLMHAGLFNSSSGTLTVNDLILTGSIANLGDKTGAISSISTTNALNLKNIVFNNLKVANYTDTGAGLMLANVGVNSYGSPTWTKANIDDISTTGYDGQKPVAAALIGNAGNDSATNTVISFVNMKVEDEKLDGDNNTGKVFKYASYIYNYKFTSDLTINNCYISYRFSKDDCDNGNVTFGDEIKDGVQYADVDRTDGDILDTAINDAKAGKYIPYIYMERNIYVNPRNGNITQGCGTYEDPYIISNSKQFLTLYLYLTGKTEYDSMFKGTGDNDDTSGIWKVVPVGGSTVNHNECSVINGTDAEHVAVNYGAEGFPSRDDLSTAYYKITADINLGTSDDMNDKNIAGEYCGLGCEKYPFSGVIIGTKSDLENYKITLPKQGTKTVISNNATTTKQLAQSTFGLIQYMGGAVVKDLDIYSQNFDLNAYYNVTEYGGGVAAKVVGGDNIIDNVNVRIKFNTKVKNDNNVLYDIKGLGGYVGTVENGSLIFRNVQGKESVSKCGYEDYAGMKTNALVLDGIANVVTSSAETLIDKISMSKSGISARTSASYDSKSEYKGEYGEQVGLYVGMVYDGYVVYEGYNDTTSDKPYTLEKSEMGLAAVYSDKYPLINGFHMLNGNVLDENTAGTSADTKKITFNADETGKLYTVNVNNTQELELLTLALNSDSLSVYYCAHNDHSTAYGYKNRCRKAAYDNVGAADAVASEDRAFAKTYDDNKSDDIGYLYPYITYKYFDYTNLTTTGGIAYDDAGYAAANYAAYKNTLSPVVKTEVTGRVNNVDIKEDFNCVISNVNKTDAAVTDYTTTYVLSKNEDGTSKTYDLSLYDLSFKGIGGIYTYDYSDFRANFDGNDNIVKFYISRAYDDEVMYSGMFNQLVYSQNESSDNITDKQFEIGNFIIKNSIVYNPNKYSIMSKYNTTEYSVTAGVHTCSTGGVAGLMKGAWKLHDITWERDEVINDDIIEYDVSGYRSVGGIIGKIDNSLSNSTYFTQEWIDANSYKMNNIDIVNCNLKGTNGNHIGVTELGSTDYYTRAGYYAIFGVGGIVGSIGVNLFAWHTVMSYGDIDINSCDMDFVDVLLKNKGFGGGFVGLLGTRYNPYSASDAQYASHGNVTVDGKDAQGNISHASNVTVRTDNTVNSVEDYSLGGMFGRIDSPRNDKIYGGNIVVTNYNMSDISVDDIRTKMHTADASIDGDGGIIGSARANYIDLSNITFTGTNTIGTLYARKNVGGLIGRLYNVSCTNAGNGSKYREDNIVNIYGCDLSGMNISAYNSCGGYIGHTMIEKINVGSETTKDVIRDSTITSVNGEKIGGIVGYIYADNGTMFQSWPVSNFINIDVINTKVINKRSNSSAGGILGGIYNVTNSSTKQTFKNINVYSENGEETLIQAGTYAGGIMGATGVDNTNYAYVSVNMDGYIGIGQKYDATTGNWASDTDTGVNIRAIYTGGIIGGELARASESYPADIMVANNHIYSMRTDGSVKIYSGGIYGMYQLSPGISNTFNSVTVKNNLIYTGRNNTDYKNSNKTTGEIGSGGLMGYMINGSNTNLYLPDVTLENNSIGYYDVTYDERNNNWKTVTLDSKDIKLVKMTANTNNPETISWDEIDDLSDDTIAEYSVAFGQFIGRHSQDNQSGQVYILNPKVTVDKDKVGSIPVIDVAMNSYAANTKPDSVTYQEGNPYNYRKYCHIVYMDDVSGTDYEDIKTSATGRYPSYISEDLIISDDVEYQFGLFKDIVEEYRNLNDGVTDTKTKNYNYITGKRLKMYMTYNDNSKYSLCGTDNNYYDITYNVKDNGNPANILNGVPVLIIDGLQPQTVGNYAAAILTNGGGVVSDSVINALNGTNNANVESSTMNKFWKITCENAYIDTDGSIHKIEDTDTRFDEHKSTSIICKNYNRLSLANSIYDQYIDAGNGEKIYTITLLSYTYTCPVATSDGTTVNREETIYIPVFVKEKVTVDSYIRVLSNEEYSLSNASKIGYKDEVTVSHDSIYTIYSEFVYDGIRNNKAFLNDKLDKFIYSENAGGVDSFTVGTKMTLIDYQTGIAYYYTVDGNLEDNNKIPFAIFKDKDGNNYEQRNISSGISDELSFNSYTSIGYKEGNDYKPGEVTYKDDNSKKGIGVERYFIIVEPAETENNIHFQLKIATEARDANNVAVDEFFNKDIQGDAAGMDMTCIPGPIIKFGGVDSNGVGTDGVTFVKGKISAEEEVNINSNIQVVLSDYDSEAPSPYWQKKFVSNTIDSANTDKYLEVSVTLLDEEGKVVAWPVGTNISINGGSKTVLDNNLIIYEYKDAGKEFAMNTVQKDILGKCYYYNVAESDEDEDMNWIHYDEDNGQWYYYVDYDAVDSRWITQYLDNEPQEKYISLSNQMDISLDFSTADIDDYAGKNYTVMLKLYRSDDPNYLNEESTKSYGGSVRQYSNNVFSESIKDLSVALSVDDILSLGINLYNNIKEKYEIPFTNKFDFSSLIHKNRVDTDIAEWTDKKYMATYRIYKKVEKSGNNDGDKDIGYNANIGNIIESAGNSEYQIIDWDDSPFELYDDSGNKLSAEEITVNKNEKQKVIITTKEFTADEIKNGTNGTKYVTEWGMNLKAKAGEFTNEDLTNYKITVTYVPYDKTAQRPETDEEQTWFDFFIFTVTKLKTDM